MAALGWEWRRAPIGAALGRPAPNLLHPLTVALPHDVAVKIKTSISLALVLLATLPVGCARPGAVSSPPGSPAVASVPPGCDPARVAVRWSDIAQEPVLEHVALFTAGAGDGKEVLAAPVTAAVTGVAAPASWLPILASGLGNEMGTRVNTTRPSDSYGTGFGTDGGVDPTIPERVAYQGSRRVSAAFSVSCTPAVRGTLVAWTETASGGLMCGGLAEPTDPYARAARRYCPRTPPPSSPS